VFIRVIDRPHLDLSEYLPYLINRIGSALVENMQVELTPYGLTITMWRVLAVLSERDRQRQIDISDLTAIDVSTLSRLVSRMIKMGLVSRVRSDTSNREVIVELTAKGRALVNRLIPTARKMEREAIAGLSQSDLAITRDCLRQMYLNVAPHEDASLDLPKPAPQASRRAG